MITVVCLPFFLAAGVTKDWEDSLIPPYNKDAKTPGDVYNLRDSEYTVIVI